MAESLPEPQKDPMPSHQALSGSSHGTSLPLSGKQEHYLKRDLISRQVIYEISELSTPTALQRFGAPFRSDYGEVPPTESDLPILRYIFVNHVRNFPFLNRAREKEFWQDKLQVFLELFANKHISSSEDRLEETKRKKLAIKAQKLVELMMVSGIPTASGYEERIRFAEMEVVDRDANEQGLLVNVPEGNSINQWDVNVAAVRTTSIKRTVRYHQHAEFILRVQHNQDKELMVGRRYGDFVKLRKQLQAEFPGKALPQLPRKNKAHQPTFSWTAGDDDDDASSQSSVSTQYTESRQTLAPEDGASQRGLFGYGHRRNHSSQSNKSRRSIENSPRRVVLYREHQRTSLRAFLRTTLQNQTVAASLTMTEFLTQDPIILNCEELEDVARRKDMDAQRIEEQQRFYEIAQERARELNVYMEQFRRDIVERNGLTKLFQEIREKPSIADLSPQYQKFAEWLRIEVAATIYHIFLAEDNSPDLQAQARRMHSMMPYVALKQVIRFANPATVMSGVLDLFLAQPFGTRSLAQRGFGMAINDGIKNFQRSIDALETKINDPVLSEKLRIFCESEEKLKNELRAEATDEGVDLIVVVLRSEHIMPALTADQIGKVFNAYVAWNHSADSVAEEMKSGAILYAQLKRLLKLYTRRRDKAQMLSIIQEPVTLNLFRDLFTIFYEPLVRVYKSANVYNSVTDFAAFADDAFRVLDSVQQQDMCADPNETVQSFIDLCARHQENFYKFVHEVHIHDDGLFTALTGWLDGILEFLRHGPAGGKLDMNALFQGAVEMKQIDPKVAIEEIDALIEWQELRKKWHQDKTRQKMAAENTPTSGSVHHRQTSTTSGMTPTTPKTPTTGVDSTSRAPSTTTSRSSWAFGQAKNSNPSGAQFTPAGSRMFKSADFGLDEADLAELDIHDDDDDDDDDSDSDDEEYIRKKGGHEGSNDIGDNEDGTVNRPGHDPVAGERKRRSRIAKKLRSRAGEPEKPEVKELTKLSDGFLTMLRMVLAE